VLVNGNPLLRFDGYYVLTDLLETPNLVNEARVICYIWSTAICSARPRRRPPPRLSASASPR
jgi:putative peptide zinc metalloprotease protein